MSGAMGKVVILYLLLNVITGIQGNFQDDLRSAEDGQCNAEQDDNDWDSIDNDFQDAMESLKGLFKPSMFGGHCEYECPDDKVLKKNPAHTSTYNGCGTDSLGVELQDIYRPEFTKCCNSHDKCYDTCESEKKACDDHFNDCLKDACIRLVEDDLEKLEECKMMGELMYKGVDMMGCQAYLDSQKEACICV